MRILIVSEDVPHPSMGGLGKHAVALARALGEAGHQVDFMGSHLYEDQRQHLVRQLGLPGAFFPDLYWFLWGWKEQRTGIFNPLRRPVQAREFARLILRRAKHYDVVHYHGHLPNVASCIPPSVNFVQTRHDQGSDCLTHTRFRNGAVCTTVDPEDCAGCATPNPTRLQGVLSSLSVRQYRGRVAEGFRRHKTVFVSEMLRRNFARVAGPGPWGVVVHNFIDFRFLEATEPARIADRNQREIFVAGKVYGAKGQESFLEALIPRMPPNMTVRVAGDGEVQHLQRRFGGPQVRFLGWQSYREVIALTLQADAVVVPSILEEAFGASTLEGIALGKIVFALHRGATPELACYVKPPAELRLLPDIVTLADAVIAFQPPAVSAGAVVKRDFDGDVHSRAQELVRIYQLTRSEWEAKRDVVSHRDACGP